MRFSIVVYRSGSHSKDGSSWIFENENDFGCDKQKNSYSQINTELANKQASEQVAAQKIIQELLAPHQNVGKIFRLNFVVDPMFIKQVIKKRHRTSSPATLKKTSPKDVAATMQALKNNC